MRLLLIGAFPFPYPQGSQVYVAAQAAGLAGAGDDVAVASYGWGEGPIPEGVEWIASSRRLAPRSGRSGPSLAKPLADLGLLATVVRAQRQRHFDMAVAHNAEAAVVASVARRLTGLRYVYVAHTLLAQELSAYASKRWAQPLAGGGARIDRWAARDADSVIVLGRAALDALGPDARGPVARIAPALEIASPPDLPQQGAACAASGLTPRHFFLYMGNLDGYQELDRLDAAAQALPDDAPPIVVATHDARSADRFRQLRVIEADFDTARCLAHASTALVATRTRTGGFPIKLLNYMEARRPIVAFEPVAEGLRHEETAYLLPDTASPDELAGALQTLAANPRLADRLASAAHHHLLTHHDPDTQARLTRSHIGHDAN